jgi:hypothetical protein
MKVCVITPTSHLELAGFGNGIHMALTHVTLESDEYVKAYQRFHNKGEYIILDNSAFELEQQGKGLDPKPILEASKAIGVDEVIATDVLCNGDETVKSTRNFIAEFEKFYSEEIRLQKPVPRIMAVPQGKSPEEWTDCYMRLLGLQGVSVIGFSKIAVPSSFGGSNSRKVDGGVTQSRLKLYDYLDENQLWPFDLNRNVAIHLLGGDSWSGYELKSIVTHKPTKESMVFSGPASKRRLIRSNDTSAPVWYGANGVSFDPFTGKASKFIEEKPDLENKRQTTAELLNKNAALIMRNINVLLKMASSNDVR